jgi:hypothetical protein
MLWIIFDPAREEVTGEERKYILESSIICTLY